MATKMLSKRKRGSVVVYVALALVVLLGAAGLSIDVGHVYLERDKAQRAADAAALAGAIQLMNRHTNDDAQTAAEKVAAANGYDLNKGATVVCTPNADGNNAYYRVYVAKPAQVFFMAVFGERFRTVGAPATATFRSNVDLDINGGGIYGANGDVTLSLFGPDGKHANGDNYSVTKLSNGSPNPLYESEGKNGYDFNIFIPDNYASQNGTSELALQIFDPDCYNVNNGSGNANGQNAQKGISIDEMRDNNGSNTSQTKYLTTTRYTIYDTKGDSNPNNDVEIAYADYGNFPASDMAWVTPSGFSIDINDLIKSEDGKIGLRMNVKSIKGSSENGFNLRAGPPITTTVTTGKGSKRKTEVRQVNVKERIVKSGTTEKTQYKFIDANGNDVGTAGWMDDNPFSTSNGTNITADGKIPMNFNANGSTMITLGEVPAKATKVEITKFDTDVTNYKTVDYYVGGVYIATGKLTNTSNSNGNDELITDTIDLPENYPGGIWTAYYQANVGDTSVWKMQYWGPSINNPAGVYLVK